MVITIILFGLSLVMLFLGSLMVSGGKPTECLVGIGFLSFGFGLFLFVYPQIDRLLNMLNEFNNYKIYF